LTLLILLLFVLSSASSASAQWGEPVNLGPNINTAGSEFGMCLTPGGDTIIFDAATPDGKGGYNLWLSWKENGGWVQARSLGDSLNSRWNEGSPFLTVDGRFLYFSSDRPNGPGDYDLYVSERRHGIWQSPQPLTYPINTRYSEGWPCLSRDGRQLYFSSNRPGGRGNLDLWRSEKREGQWSEPVNLGDSVNGPGWECCPSLSRDGKEMYFRRDTVTGLSPASIWKSVKMNGVWQKAVRLGPPVNRTGISNSSPFLARDGRELYFCSDREPSRGLFDIFVSKWKGDKP
jgi:Tol biopolymer transport system component